MDQTVKRTGMIGLGAMGLQFARHMQRKGFDVAGYDINADAVRHAENDGIRHRGSAAEIGKHAEVVVVMVATDEQVESVVEGSGLIDALAPGAVICIAARWRRKLAGASPRSRRPRVSACWIRPSCSARKPPTTAPARSMSAARSAGFCARARCCKLLAATSCISAMSTSGQIAKMINNMLLWATMVANFESLTLAKQLGMDIPKLAAALGHGSGANWSLSRWGKSTGKWAEKDMDTALELAQAAKVAVPLGGLVDQLVNGINQEKMKALLS